MSDVSWASLVAENAQLRDDRGSLAVLVAVAQMRLAAIRTVCNFKGTFSWDQTNKVDAIRIIADETNGERT